MIPLLSWGGEKKERETKMSSFPLFTHWETHFASEARRSEPRLAVQSVGAKCHFVSRCEGGAPSVRQLCWVHISIGSLKGSYRDRSL